MFIHFSIFVFCLLSFFGTCSFWYFVMRLFLKRHYKYTLCNNESVLWCYNPNKVSLTTSRYSSSQLVNENEVKRRDKKQTLTRRKNDLSENFQKIQSKKTFFCFSYTKLSRDPVVRNILTKQLRESEFSNRQTSYYSKSSFWVVNSCWKPIFYSTIGKFSNLCFLTVSPLSSLFDLYNRVQLIC